MDSKVLMVKSTEGSIPPGTVQAGVNVKGETLYIAQYEPRRYVNEYPFGVVTPSQEMIAYCDYTGTSDNELTLKLCVRYEALTGTNCVAFYWKSCDEYPEKDQPKYFPKDAVLSNRTCKKLFYFVAQVDPHIIKDSKVVGSYSKSKFPADCDGPLVGFGQAWYGDGILVQGHCTPINTFKVHVPYDGQIYEVCKFSFLCSYQMPSLSRFTYPRDEWVKVFGHPLPSNAFPAGIAPDGEVLYVGRAERPNYNFSNHNYSIPGHVFSWNMHLHVTWDKEELVYDSHDGFEMLTVKNPELFEWVIDSRGKVPRNAVIGGHGEFAHLYYIGRTVTGSDLSVGQDHKNACIRLPRNANTQLVGRIDNGYGSMCVAWKGKEYYYESYEVLVLNKRYSPKNLKRLCRNAIITATMGMPDRLNQLDLPAQLKDFCKVTGRVVD